MDHPVFDIIFERLYIAGVRMNHRDQIAPRIISKSRRFGETVRQGHGRSVWSEIEGIGICLIRQTAHGAAQHVAEPVIPVLNAPQPRVRHAGQTVQIVIGVILARHAPQAPVVVIDDIDVPVGRVAISQIHQGGGRQLVQSDPAQALHDRVIGALVDQRRELLFRAIRYGDGVHGARQIIGHIGCECGGREFIPRCPGLILQV